MKRNHNNPKNQRSPSSKPRITQVAGALLAFGFGGVATGADITLSDQPLATAAAVQPKPNLLFILDNSGSMDSAYMPDDMSSSSKYGYWSAQCNGVAFDPTESYPAPMKADKTSYPDVSFTNAPDDGYVPTGSKSDLTENYFYLYTGSQPKMSWNYNFAGVDKTTQFYTECMTSTSSASSVFTYVALKTESTAIQQKYANWYSYYRKRFLLMRTAMGRALSKLDDSYRVGFSTISDTKAIDGTKYFRDVKDFNTSQRSNIYSSLYGSSPNSSTPLRATLSKAGRYFAKKAPGQTYDPMQYACQRNYALLSTDGYWNTGLETTTYGPFIVDANTSVGQQDGAEQRPMLDTAATVTTRKTKYTAIAYRDKTSAADVQSRTRPWTRTKTTYSPGVPGSCNGQYIKRVYNETSTQPQRQEQYFVTPQQASYSYTTTETLINGQLSESSNSAVTIGTWGTKTGASTVTYASDTGTPTVFTTPASASSTTCSALGVNPSYSTATAGSWTSWSPTSITYAYTDPVVGTYAAGTPTSSDVSMGGVGDTLADVAEYYWKNDLRQDSYGNCKSTSSGMERDVCANVLNPVGVDTNKAQHMSTYTIGLGTNGTLTYDTDYPTQTTGDFADVKSGKKIWPEPGDGKGAENIDDLWHAAVNGRGKYFSALSASSLSNAISSVFSSVHEDAGAAAAAATTSLELISGANNKLFSASYTTQQWTGDLKAYSLNGTTGVVDKTPIWEAQKLLDTRVDSLTHSNRTIYFNSSSNLAAFSYNNLTATQKGYFNNLCVTSALSQCASLSTDEKANANSGDKLVNYLRGDRTYETGKANGAFRKREHVLGDIINGAPVYVGKPPFKYSDTGYADFVTANLNRKSAVYVAANDGMLHAISATDGTEFWAFIPSAVIPNLYKLAESDYASKHRYFVDGAPTIGDVKIGGVWKTILVGGLNKGGKSYYALDVTDPDAPKMLWEFTSTDMGYSFGAPVITKRADGTWVVAVTSGINNSTGDGKGHLYLINAATGALLLDLPTSEGSASTPSNLSQLNTWIDSDTNNTSLRFYGGDMLGNLWRFDTDSRYGASPSAVKLAVLRSSVSTTQPITTRPVTVELYGKPVVIVGTGRYMGDPDILDTNDQSVYAIRDPLTTTGWGDVQADTTNFTRQTMTVSGTSASITSNTVDWTKGGWWLNFPNSGERMFVDMDLQLNTLAISTAIPNGNPCSSGGSSWLYFLNAATGSKLSSAPDAGSRFSPDTLVVGANFVKDAEGNIRLITQDNKGDITTDRGKDSPPPTSATAHRTSWRELID